MSFHLPLLITVFNGQTNITNLTEVQWDLLIRQARKAMLLAKLYYFVEQRQLLGDIPPVVLRHLKSGQVHAEKQFNDLHWELRHLERIAKKLEYPLVLLKGAAYVIGGMKAAKGRIFSDIDIMVSFDSIANTEKQLMIQGWVSSNLDAYDQRYYREWMHEIPAMYHMFRGSVIDLHHNILPRTVKACPNADLLLTNARPLSEYHGISLLAHEDMIIHSATHLFYDGELEHGCRDIMDLNDLLSEFIEEGYSVNDLVVRANELGLQKPVYYALRYVHMILGFPVSDEVINKLNQNIPTGIMIPIMDFLFIRALMPDHTSCNDRWTGFARWLLYVRSHWLRMPLHQLIPHLLRKSYRRMLSKETH